MPVPWVLAAAGLRTAKAGHEHIGVLDADGWQGKGGSHNPAE